MSGPGLIEWRLVCSRLLLGLLLIIGWKAARYTCKGGEILGVASRSGIRRLRRGNWLYYDCASVVDITRETLRPERNDLWASCWGEVNYKRRIEIAIIQEISRCRVGCKLAVSRGGTCVSSTRLTIYGNITDDALNESLTLMYASDSINFLIFI